MNIILTFCAVIIAMLMLSGCSTVEHSFLAAQTFAEGISNDLGYVGSELAEYNDQRAANRELAEFKQNSNYEAYVQEVSYEQ